MAGWNDDLIADFRAHGKVTKGPFLGRDVLLLTTKGAKSGLDRTNPVVFTRDGDKLVVVASKGGAPTSPGWYHNLKAHPDVKIEVGTETIEVRAEEVTGAERNQIYTRQASLYPQFAQYQQKTKRLIPVIAFIPKTRRK